MPPYEPIEKRLWDNVDKTSSPIGCWEWRGFVNPSGYGHIYWKTRPHRVHRVSWMLLRGPIPEDKQLDHLCRNRICVNPEHLEVVTAKENTRRGFSPSGMRARQTHCIRGHSLSGDNLYHKNVGTRVERHCRQCDRDRCRRWYMANREHCLKYAEDYRNGRI